MGGVFMLENGQARYIYKYLSVSLFLHYADKKLWRVIVYSESAV